MSFRNGCWSEKYTASGRTVDLPSCKPRATVLQLFLHEPERAIDPGISDARVKRDGPDPANLGGLVAERLQVVHTAEEEDASYAATTIFRLCPRGAEAGLQRRDIVRCKGTDAVVRSRHKGGDGIVGV